MMDLGLVWLLRAAWVATILPILIAFAPSPKLNSFRGVVLGIARRGKILEPASQKFTVPQKFFCHFYVVGVLWTSILLVTTWLYAYSTAPLASTEFHFSGLASHLTGGSHISWFHKSHLTPPQNRFRVWLSVFLLLLMEAQVLRRLIESFYVFKYSPSARMHVFGYLTGLFFYTAAPLSLCYTIAPEVAKFAGNQVAEFIARGKGGSCSSEFEFLEAVKPLAKLGLSQWIGAAVFLWGWIHQRRCHLILGSIRGNGDRPDRYAIPRGDWFEIVSSPHYLAEVVIYIGLVIASGGSDMTVWLLLGFVVANLAFAAAETHRWYLQKFEDYPKNRRAIFPFLY